MGRTLVLVGSLSVLGFGCSVASTSGDDDIVGVDAGGSGVDANGTQIDASTAQVDASTTQIDGGGQVTSLAKGEYCAAFVDVTCTANLSCCNQAAGTYDSVSACVSDQTPLCEQFLSGAAFNDGRIVYDPIAAATAYNQQVANAASCAVPSPGGDGDGVFTGTVASGGSCSATYEDQSPLMACAPGLACDATFTSETTVEGTCQTPKSVGQSCDSPWDCAANAYCPPPSGPEGSTCQSMGSNGASCEEGYECTTGICDGQCIAPTADHAYCLSTE